MVGTTLRQQVLNFVRYMHEQGILDFRFDRLTELQSPQNPHLVSDLISMYITIANLDRAEVTRLMNEEFVDFGYLITNVEQLKRRSIGIGGCRLGLVVDELLDASFEGNRERCIEILTRVKSEYKTLRDNLHHIRQLELSILANENRRRGR